MDGLWSIAVDGMGGQAEQNRSIAGVVRREGRRLFRFIRRRVKDQADAEDILQEVFYELTEAYRLMKPIEQAGAWLYRVARNRIVDRFRKKQPEQFANLPEGEEGPARFEDLLPSPDAGPEAEYVRGVLLEELEAALEELPEEQREVFVAHEIEGRSFKKLAEESGISVNTLLARKRYAVLHLRRRLAAIYEEFRNR
jgi:RNA polymerase sigma factor (sigma-70 family)